MESSTLDRASEVLLADDRLMETIGKVTCDVTLPNGSTNRWPFTVVKSIEIDGFIGSDLMKRAGAITDHLTDTVYFRPENLTSDVNTLEQCNTAILQSIFRQCDSIQDINVRFSADVCVKAG